MYWSTRNVTTTNICTLEKARILKFLTTSVCVCFCYHSQQDRDVCCVRTFTLILARCLKTNLLLEFDAAKDFV